MKELVVDFLAYMVLALDLSIIGYVLTKTVRHFLDTPFEEKFSALDGFLENYYQELALLVASTSTFGSLYLSNVMEWTPCRLCWFQRIFMYPLVFILAVSLFFNRERVEEYVLPLSMTGMAFAIYHYAVQRVSQFQSAGCSITSVSCETQHTFYFGYINIPMMALTGFAAITLLMYLGWKKL
jgi:disulfide bond formation protein DsbB